MRGGWWLFTAAVTLALVAFVHFLSREEREAPIRDIYAVYGNPAWGVLALVVLCGLLLSLAALFVTALRAVLARRMPVWKEVETMMLKVARFVNLVLAGLLVGNEFGTKVAIQPSLINCTN